MKYTIIKIGHIHVHIMNNAGKMVGQAFLYLGRGWEIYDRDFRYIDLARWKREIISVFDKGGNRATSTPEKRRSQRRR